MCWKPSTLWTGVLLVMCSVALEVQCRPPQQLNDISNPSSLAASLPLDFPHSLQRRSLVATYLGKEKKTKNDETKSTSFTIASSKAETTTMSTPIVPTETEADASTKKPPEERFLEAGTSTPSQDVQFIASEHVEFKAGDQMDSEASTEGKTSPVNSSESEDEFPQNVTDAEPEPKPRHNSEHAPKTISEPEPVPTLEQEIDTYIEKKTNPTLSSNTDTDVLMSSETADSLLSTDKESKKDDFLATESKPKPVYEIPTANVTLRLLRELVSTDAELQLKDKLPMEDGTPQSIIEHFVSDSPSQTKDEESPSVADSATSSLNATDETISDIYTESEHELAITFYDDDLTMEAGQDSVIEDNKNTDTEVNEGSVPKDSVSFMAEADKSYMLENNKTPLFKTEKYSLPRTDKDVTIGFNIKSVEDEEKESHSESDEATVTVGDTKPDSKADKSSRTDFGNFAFMDSDNVSRRENKESSLIIPTQDSMTEINQDITVVINKELTLETDDEFIAKITEDFIEHTDKNATEYIGKSVNGGNDLFKNTEEGRADNEGVKLIGGLIEEVNDTMSKGSEDYEKKIIKSDPIVPTNDSSTFMNTNDTTENEGVPLVILYEEEAVSDSSTTQRDYDEQENTPEPEYKDESSTLHSQYVHTTPVTPFMTWLRIRMSVDPPCDCNETPKTVIEAPEDLDIVLDPWRHQRTWDLTGDFKPWKKPEEDCDEDGSGSFYHEDGSGAKNQYYGSRSASQEGLGEENHEGSGTGSQKENYNEADSTDEAMKVDAENDQSSEYKAVTMTEEGNDVSKMEVTYKESNQHSTVDNVKNVVTILNNKIKTMEGTVKDLVENGEDSVMTYAKEMRETVEELAKKGRELVEENVEKTIAWEKELITSRRKE